MLVGAGFFGYMLALLQRRVGTIVSSHNVSTLFNCNVLASELYKMNTFSSDVVKLMLGYIIIHRNYFRSV